MQYAIGLYMAPIHRHLSADEIRSYFQDPDAKGAGQAIGQSGFDDFGGGGAFPDYKFLAFRLAGMKFWHDLPSRRRADVYYLRCRRFMVTLPIYRRVGLL
jgi:hypothetical protein